MMSQLRSPHYGEALFSVVSPKEFAVENFRSWCARPVTIPLFGAALRAPRCVVIAAFVAMLGLVSAFELAVVPIVLAILLDRCICGRGDGPSDRP